MRTLTLLLIVLLSAPSLAVLPQGWELFSHTPAHYEGNRDTSEAHQGRACGRLAAGPGVQSHHWVSLFQRIRSEQFRGRTVLLKGQLKADRVTGWAGLWLRVEDRKENVLAFENSSKKPLRGSGDWQPFQVEVKVPETADVLHFGVLLAGAGEVRVDSLSLQATGPGKPVKEIIADLRERALPSEPSNLDFEK